MTPIREIERQEREEVDRAVAAAAAVCIFDSSKSHPEPLQCCCGPTRAHAGSAAGLCIAHMLKLLCRQSELSVSCSLSANITGLTYAPLLHGLRLSGGVGMLRVRKFESKRSCPRKLTASCEPMQEQEQQETAAAIAAARRAEKARRRVEARLRARARAAAQAAAHAPAPTVSATAPCAGTQQGANQGDTASPVPPASAVSRSGGRSQAGASDSASPVTPARRDSSQKPRSSRPGQRPGRKSEGASGTQKHADTRGIVTPGTAPPLVRPGSQQQVHPEAAHGGAAMGSVSSQQQQGRPGQSEPGPDAASEAAPGARRRSRRPRAERQGAAAPPRPEAGSSRPLPESPAAAAESTTS